jgi:hypothetical protein
VSGAVRFPTAWDVGGRLDWPTTTEALAAGHRGPPPVVGDLFLTRGGDTLFKIDRMAGRVILAAWQSGDQP